MEINQYISLGLSALGLFGGLFSYVLGLRIKQEILENNGKLEKEILAVRDREDEKRLRVEKELADLQSGLSDRILNTINGKYVRIDLHQQSVTNIQDRFVSMKELIEVNMEKIEQGLDRQILDLKERIFDKK